MKKYFKNASYHEVLNSVDANPNSLEWVHQGLRFGATVSRKIRERAEERYNEMEPEIFLAKCSRFTEEYQMKETNKKFQYKNTQMTKSDKMEELKEAIKKEIKASLL